MDSEDNTDNEIIDGEENVEKRSNSKRSQGREHMEQLERLKQKDPEFFEYLKEHDKELLHFNDVDIDDDVDSDMENADLQPDDKSGKHEIIEKKEKPFNKAITIAMVDSWCNSIQENGNFTAVRSLLRAFRTACHYGDDGGDEKLSVMSSSVFNKIMLFVLNEMDGILRKLLKVPPSVGKRETIKDLITTKQWKNYNNLVKSYLGNALHVLNQMTDTQMISFTLRRLKYSSMFLGAFPSLLRKYIKVALHFWGTGGGALPVVSFLFLRDLCIRLGSDCLDECFKGIYKAYVVNCQFLAMILREALNTKTKEAFRKVYEWKFMNCLELWTNAVCAYSAESDFKPLAYPLTQIISGVARLVPTARYFPLRLKCVRMLNRISASTSTFIPVSMLLLDMLEMKELNRPPTGGVGKAVDLCTTLKVSKPTLKTRAFQEACVFSVVEELTEHLAQWSYSVAFFESSFIPVVRLRSFCKSTKVERFRKEMRQLIRQIEANNKFVNERRTSVSFLPNDPAGSYFLEDERKSSASPLSQYALTLRQRAYQRTDSLKETSVLVGEESSVFRNKIPESDEEDHTNNGEGTYVFGSSWLPGNSLMINQPAEMKAKKNRRKHKELAMDEDIVEDLVLSSEEEGSLSDSPSDRDDDNRKLVPTNHGKQRPPTKMWKRGKSSAKRQKSKSAN
ncbi:nucleolar complex protein 2-like [Quillaja saponaria]|uniref:Nucleolar complex protein 2-like n=1 Tax=Quillaja saponaria TaxID=32244 RepID=A0AAD7PJ19_QUISA|nr:nucleolar complex protein 2-like [Quillaja saponaria]